MKTFDTENICLKTCRVLLTKAFIGMCLFSMLQMSYVIVNVSIMSVLQTFQEALTQMILSCIPISENARHRFANYGRAKDIHHNEDGKSDDQGHKLHTYDEGEYGKPNNIVRGVKQNNKYV